MAKKCTKKHDARANLLFFLNKPIAVLTFSLPVQSSVLKLPINRRGLRILPGCCEYGPLLLSKENRRTNTGRTKRNPQLFDSPPACWVYLATSNLSDNPGQLSTHSDRVFIPLSTSGY